MLRIAKEAAKKLFHAFGLDIRKNRPAETERASMRGALRQLKSLGFAPHTVIDVGVAYETADLYREFPNARILLIEPQAEFEPCLQQICRQYKAEYVLAAAGAEAGTATFNVHEDQLNSSSLLKEVEGGSVDGVPRKVKVVTIDEVCAEKKMEGPYFLKLDVQGAELQVLAGAQKTLQETEAVHLEATFFGTLIGGPQVYDVVQRMKELGFVVYDIGNFFYRPLDNALAQADLVFVREYGRFRESHAFATPKQRRALALPADPRLAIPKAGRR
jgi:FkbM family methyltransferase